MQIFTPSCSTPTRLCKFTRPLATAKENPQLQGANQPGKGAKREILFSLSPARFVRYGVLRYDIPTSSVFGG